MPVRRAHTDSGCGAVRGLLNGAATLINSDACTRRDFFGAVGAGIAILIGADDRVTVFSGKIEMGQGVLTSQAQIAAEELDVDLTTIDMVLGDTERCPWDMGTFGSSTTRMFGPALRAAAAEARVVLIGLAAVRLGVAQRNLATRSGRVCEVADPQRSVSYAELAKGRRILRHVGDKAILRQAADFRVMGRSPVRLDGRENVMGAANYAADIRRPGMLYAKLLRPPFHGAELLHADTAAASAMPDIKVVEHADLIAVLHADPESPAAGLAQIKAQWSTPTVNWTPERIFDHVVAASSNLQTNIDRGDVTGALAGAKTKFQSRYLKGYVAHAPIEPHAAIADVTADGATSWASPSMPTVAPPLAAVFQATFRRFASSQ